MNNQLIRQLLKESINQNYISVYTTINENIDELDESTAAKIFIECCRVFYEKDKDLWGENNKENITCLFHILFICNGRIKKINDNLLLGYFQSMYFLVVHLHEKNKYEKLLEVNNLLMPNFMNGSKNGKVLKVYNSICNHIYNIICELNNSNKSDILYYSFVTLLQKMRSLHYPTKLELAESTCIFIKNKKFSDCNEHIQHNLFTFMLELINKNEKNEADIKHLEDVYCATLKMLEVFIGVNIMKQHKLNKVKEIIDVAISMTSKTCHTIVYQKLFGLILDVIKLIIQLTINEECIEAVTKTFDSCIEDFNDYCKSFGYSTNLQKTCNTISVLIYNWVEYFLTSKPSWTFLEQKEIQKMLFKFVSGVGKVVGKIPIKCCLCSNCEVKTDLKTSVTITCLIGNLWKLSVAQTEEISISLCLMVLHYLENCCTNIKTLKNLNCPSWKNLWNEVGTTVYNIGVKLYTRKTRECLKFFTLAVHTQSSLEGIGENSIFKFNIVNSCLMCLTETYLQFNEYNAALTFAALLVSTNNSENVHRHWIRCKQSAVRESTDAEILVYTELTVVECLQQNAEKIRTVYPDFSCNFKNSDIIKLLIDELENYKIFWQSKVPMKCAFLKLYEVADLITSIKALIKYWGFNAFLLQEDIFLLLPKMLGKLERESSLEKMEKQILLASLYAIQYYGETLKARNKMMDTFNNTVVIEEPTPLPHEQPKNPNDEFDLMSSYVNLKIDVHGKIWDILSNSLSIFEECLSETVLPSTVEMIKEYDVYKIVLNIIYEFKIHCNSLKVISACFLGLRISKVLENNIFTLEIASLLLEEKTVSSTMSKDILAECNSIEKELCNSDDATDAILTQYHISKSLMYLREENVKLGYEEYQIACKYFDKLPTEKKYQVIKLKMEFLHVKYLQLPCKFNIEGHDSHSLEKFSQIYNDTTINYKELGCRSLSTTLMYMEVSQFVANFYKWMHLPREVRCFCRDIVTLVQMLVFPIRTAYFIIYLAQADLLSSRLSDCQNKLRELANILCLRNDKPMDVEYQSTIKKTKNVGNLIEGMRDINLNSNNDRQLMGSPELPIQDFQFPAFMKHSDDCDCFYCVNVEYKCLILMYMNLVAELNLSQGNLEVASSYFQNGLRIYEYMVNSKQQRCFENKITQQLSSYPFYNLQDILCPTYSIMLLQYGNFLLKLNDFTKAHLINKSLMDLISKQKYSNMFLCNEVRFQKMLLVMVEMEPLESELQVNAMESNENLEIVKTPENKKTQVLCKLNTTPVRSPPKRRLRKIKCDLFNEDEVKEKSDAKKRN